jgi:repressor LexA
MQPLTEKQQKILSFIENYSEQNTTAPSFQEIMEHFGFASPNAVTKHVQALVRKGFLQSATGSARRKARSMISSRPSVREVPLIGRIAAGIPLEAIETSGRKLDLIDLGIDNTRGEFFALVVRGQSMIDAHILNDDIVVIKKQADVTEHEAAVVMWNGEATLKYVKKLKEGINLIPANRLMQPIHVRSDNTISFQILGKVVRVIRNC